MLHSQSRFPYSLHCFAVALITSSLTCAVPPCGMYLTRRSRRAYAEFKAIGGTPAPCRGGTWPKNHPVKPEGLFCAYRNSPAALVQVHGCPVEVAFKRLALRHQLGVGANGKRPLVSSTGESLRAHARSRGNLVTTERHSLTLYVPSSPLRISESAILMTHSMRCPSGNQWMHSVPTNAVLLVVMFRTWHSYRMCLWVQGHSPSAQRSRQPTHHHEEKSGRTSHRCVLDRGCA
jgi:hypothetical protein